MPSRSFAWLWMTDGFEFNNIIIEAYLNISVKSYTTMPVGSNIKDVSIKELVFVDIINGKVPNYVISSVK